MDAQQKRISELAGELRTLVPALIVWQEGDAEDPDSVDWAQLEDVCIERGNLYIANGEGN